MNTIVILYGGEADEALISRKSAINVLNACVELGHNPFLLNIGNGDIPAILLNIDDPLVLNLVHGRWGEDGSAQRLLDSMQIPYFGSSANASELTFDKVKFRELMHTKVRMPNGAYMSKQEYTDLSTGRHIVKVHNSGSTVGVYYIDNDIDKLGLISKWHHNEKRIVEEFIPGVEGATIVYNNQVIGGVIVNYKGHIFDYDTKYDPNLSNVEDWDILSDSVRDELSKFSLCIYNECGCSGFLCVDFRLDEANVPYILEANSIPGMTQCSLVPYTFRKIGIDFNGVVKCMIDSAIQKVVVEQVVYTRKG